MKILSPYAPIRAHTPAIRSAKVILDMIGHCPMLRRRTQLQIAGENDHFKNMVRSFHKKFELDFQASSVQVLLDFQITPFISCFGSLSRTAQAHPRPVRLSRSVCLPTQWNQRSTFETNQKWFKKNKKTDFEILRASCAARNILLDKISEGSRFYWIKS